MTPNLVDIDKTVRKALYTSKEFNSQLDLVSESGSMISGGISYALKIFGINDEAIKLYLVDDFNELNIDLNNS